MTQLHHSWVSVQKLKKKITEIIVHQCLLHHRHQLRNRKRKFELYTMEFISTMKMKLFPST